MKSKAIWLKRHLRGVRVRMVLLLIPFLATVYFVAHWLRFEDQMNPERLRQFGITLFPLLAVKSVLFCIVRCLPGLGALRHVS